MGCGCRAFEMVEPKKMNVGGSCCQSCAEAAERIDARTLMIYHRPFRFEARMKPDMAVSGLLGERARPWSEVEALNGDVEQFGRDVAKWWSGQIIKSGDDESFIRDWSSWFGSWRAWFAGDHDRQIILGDAIRGDELKHFDDGERAFRDLRRRGVTIGVATEVQAPPAGAPLAQWFADHKWIVPVGLAVAALALLSPLIGPVLGSIFAAKAVSTGAKVAVGAAL